MFENQNKYQDYLSLALLKLLNENTFYDIKPETIIKSGGENNGKHLAQGFIGNSPKHTMRRAPPVPLTQT